MTTANLFTHYKQRENHFTNTLLGILSISRIAESTLLSDIIHKSLGLGMECEIDEFQVLGGYVGTADGQMVGANCCIHIETKIVSGTLSRRQIRRHLKELAKKGHRVKRLVLLTPDESESQYVARFQQIDRSTIVHLAWKQVSALLVGAIAQTSVDVFGELLCQFQLLVKKMVFEQDYVGVVLKIKFGDESEVYPDTYLENLGTGKWPQWSTPRKYNELDGRGRKRLLYDRTRQAITAEGVINRVKHTKEGRGFPWVNYFEPGSINVYSTPIPIEHIHTVPGFENFGQHRKDRTPYRNITHEQYRLLRGRDE